MSSLDDKLGTIWRGMAWGDDGEAVIRMIKQAFVDAGYTNVEPACNIANHMTGQEWYERFEKEIMTELSKMDEWADILPHNMASEDTKNLLMSMGIVAAAKRAAGLNES